MHQFNEDLPVNYSNGEFWNVYGKYYKQNASAMSGQLPTHACPDYTGWMAKAGWAAGSAYAMNLVREADGYPSNSTWATTWTNGGKHYVTRDKWDTSIAMLGDGTAAATGGFPAFLSPSSSESDPYPIVGTSNGGQAIMPTFGTTGSGRNGDPERHSGRANYLFADGHAETLSPDEAWHALTGK
jgi:prepilin-type processing-associated H-X9-DG protein